MPLYQRNHHFILLGMLIAAIGTGLGGCGRGGDQVVVYTALDREFSGPLLYARGHAGVDVRPKFDVECTKTVGLTQLILAESKYPRCDLFWNHEILNTVRLKERGRLDPFRPSGGDDIPAAYKAKDGTWYGFAARARVLLVNTRLVAEGDRPTGLLDLTAPRWRGRIGLAKPLFGTTATHAACLFAAWVDAEARASFEALRTNEARVLSGKQQLARAVGSGELAFGLTDTDDAVAERASGSPVAIVYPDRRADQLGTLFVPNTLPLIKGVTHRRAAESLAGLLLSPKVEAAPARGPIAQIPLNPRVEILPDIETPRIVHSMEVDFEAAARLWDEVVAYLASTFAG